METQTQSQTETQSQTAPSLTGKRANWTIAHKIEGEVITFTVKGAGTLTLDMQRVSEVNRKRAALHGMVQRVSDAAAMARDSKTGASATPEAKFARMRGLVEHYVSGAEGWSPARSTEGVGRPRAGNVNAELLVAALRLFNTEKSEETVREFVKGLGATQITALLLSEQLKDAVELAREQQREQEAREAAGVNAEELLSGL